ncbi:MAG: [protein-PII] uridylyltransferase family protein [Coriobacteriia bacterium]
MTAASPLGWFIERRSALIELAIPGTAAAAELSQLTDEAVLSQTRAASSRVGTPFAVLALGGYGAARLLPGSDIDLLIISAGTSRDLEPLVRSLLYPLWDVGLAVGHQIRTPKDQVRAVREDLTVATSFLTARFVAGDEAMAGRVIGSVFARLLRDKRSLLARIAARERPGSPYLLEPDLKDGAGGQRDIDELVWRTALALGAPAHSPAGLVETGLLTGQEAALLASAQDAITAARWAVHRTGARVHNTLFVADLEELPVDATATQRALESVHHTLLGVRDRAAGRPPVPETPITFDELVGLAREGASGIDTLERAVYAGRLEHAVPGLRETMTLRRPALSHRYTVGSHSLYALTALFDGTAVAAGMLPALVIATLTHDLGKREPGPGHAPRGSAYATEAAGRFGLPYRTGTDASRLVREHLLLSEVATTRDLADESIVLAAAARIGDPALINPLFALTAADMRATGPDVWTPWRATLVAELANKLGDALSPNVDGAGIVRDAETTREAARTAALSRGASRAVLAFLEHAPLRYLARRNATQVLRDALLVQSIAGPGAPGRFALGVTAGPTDGTWVLDVITRDRQGLFATLSGALTLSGLDALAAEAHTGAAGIALDTFTVSSANRAPAGTETWRTLERILAAALCDRYEIDTRLAERRKHYPGPARAELPAIRVDTAGRFTSTVRVEAPDRVGLLHDLTRAFQAAGLDIQRAVITTRADMADDVFEVTDRNGSPPSAGTLTETLIPLLEQAAAVR